MSDKRIQASARVRVTLEILPSDRWGAECRLDQVWKQGGESGVNHLFNLLKDEICAGRIRIIGEPEVQAVVAKIKR